MNFLNLNKSHIIDRIIPKEMLYENAELSEKEKTYFVKSVKRVKLYYTITTENSNIPSDIINDCNYDEIIFIELKLRSLENRERILKIIHSSIPKPLVIIVKYEDDLSISVAEKTNINNKIKLSEQFISPSITDNETISLVSYDKIIRKTLSETYKSYVDFVKEQLANEIMEKSELNNSELPSDKVDEFLELQQELESLSDKMKKEEQLKKRVEISLEINRIKAKIETLS